MVCLPDGLLCVCDCVLRVLIVRLCYVGLCVCWFDLVGLFVCCGLYVCYFMFVLFGDVFVVYYLCLFITVGCCLSIWCSLLWFEIGCFVCFGLV